MANESDIEIISLIISLVALGIAWLAFGQQTFGTASGYRVCRSSVVGPWSQLTYPSPRFLELRLETVFYTPHFVMMERDGKQWRRPGGRPIDGPPVSEDVTRPFSSRLRGFRSPGSRNDPSRKGPFPLLGDEAALEKTRTKLRPATQRHSGKRQARC